MSYQKILHILTILILLNINTFLAVETEVDVGKSVPNQSFLQILASNCFIIRNETSKNTSDIADDLNGKLEAQLFISTTTGLKVDTKTFANLLTNCITAQANVKLPPEELRNDVQNLANYFVFGNREISYEQVKDLMHSKRSKRNAEGNPLNAIQQLLLDLIISPLKTAVNVLLDNASNIVKSFAIPSETVNNPVQSIVQETTNGVINSILSLIDSVKNNLNSMLDSFVTPISRNQNKESKSNALVRMKTNRDIFSDIIESTLVGPIRSTINRIIVTLNGTIYSFYTTAPTENPIQSALNGIINEAVTNCLPIINQIYTVVNGVLNEVSNGNITV